MQSRYNTTMGVIIIAITSQGNSILLLFQTIIIRALIPAKQPSMDSNTSVMNTNSLRTILLLLLLLKVVKKTTKMTRRMMVKSSTSMKTTTLLLLNLSVTEPSITLPDYHNLDTVTTLTVMATATAHTAAMVAMVVMEAILSMAATAVATAGDTIETKVGSR